MEIVYRKLADLVANPKNPRKQGSDGVRSLAESIKNNPKFFEARPILLSDRLNTLMIIAGERRSEAAALLEMEKVPTILLSGLTEEQEDEIMIRDNTHSGVWDFEKLKEWDTKTLQKWNVNKKDFEGKLEMKVNPYTTKISEFIYEPRGEKPNIKDCVNTEKMDAVLAYLDKAKISKAEKEIFKICAYRFAEIDFSKMAEYYAQSKKEVQEAMEENFLVIIDFDKAREKGYVRLRKDLFELIDKEISDAND